jgi:hypothetical protein
MSNQLGITQKYCCGMMITVKEGCRISAEERQKGIENMFEKHTQGFLFDHQKYRINQFDVFHHIIQLLTPQCGFINVGYFDSHSIGLPRDESSRSPRIYFRTSHTSTKLGSAARQIAQARLR